MKKILGLLGALACSATQAAAEKNYTNFVIIFMDDLGYGDLVNNGAIGYQMPNLEKMQQEGMLFTHFYAAQAVSGASRAGLMTGCYPNRIGMSGAGDHTSKTGIHDNEWTIAEILKQKGYATAAFGKWHLGHHSQFLPIHHGFDEYCGIPYSNDMWPNHPTGYNYYPKLPFIKQDKVVELNPDQTQLTTRFTEYAVDFIDRNKKKPFFLYLAHPMPHVPLFVSDKFKGRSEQGLYGDVMMEIDWSVGEVLQKLEEEGLDKNTLVVVTSDNGPWINYGNHAGSTGGLREGKGTSFEGGMRVPCLMQWKGIIPAGDICNKLSSTIDLLPTFAKIAEAPLPHHKIDGIDLGALLTGDKTVNPRKNFYYYYRRNSLEAVQNGTFKLILPHRHRTYEGFAPGNDGKPGKNKEFHPLEEMLLFDLRRDPGERYNVLDQYPEVVTELLELVENARIDLGDELTKRQGLNVRPVGTLHE